MTHRLATILTLVLILAAPGMAANATTDDGGTPGTPVQTSLPIDLDPQTTIVDGYWTQDGLTLIVESQIPRSAYVKDMNQVPDSGQFSYAPEREVILSQGRNVITISAQRRGGERQAYLRIGKNGAAFSTGGEPLLPDQITGAHLALSVIVGISITLLIQYIYAWRRENKHTGTPIPHPDF